MSTRIDNAFVALGREKRAALITFIMGGDPDLATTAELLAALPEAGADIIEIGIPFSDPMADGPVIQAAGLRALRAGTKLRHILQLVADFRVNNAATPIVLMGYYNPVYHYGVDSFCLDAARAGVDGLILVDLPPEEEAEFKPQAEAAGIAFIRLVAPTSVPGRLPLLVRGTRGFVYYIAVAGITGGKSAQVPELQAKLAAIKQQTNLPVAVGFGIKTPEQAAAISAHADAVVVGSALVECAHKEGVPAALQLVRALAAGLRAAA